MSDQDISNGIPLSSYRINRSDTKLFSDIERGNFDKGDKPWPFYGEDTEPYDLVSEKLFPGVKSIAEVIDKINKKGGNTTTIDVGGPPDSFIARTNAQSGLSITLNNFHSPDPTSKSVVYTQKGNPVIIVPGDIFKNKTRLEVERELYDLNPEGAGLVIERALGGVSGRLGDMPLHYSLLKWLYSLTSSRDGILLMEVPYNPSTDNIISNWVDGLNKSGINAVYDLNIGTLKIIKSSNGNLPSLGEL